MTLAIGQRKMMQAPWGMIARVGVSAVLSMIDMATDVYTVTFFLHRGMTTFANATIATIVISMVLPLLLVYSTGHKKTKRELLIQCAIVLSGFKPVIDTYRIVKGVETHSDDVVSAATSSMFSKISLKVCSSGLYFHILICKCFTFRS